MARVNLSSKHIQIDKANLTIVVATAVATFVTVFSLVAGKALLSQRAYQARVIEKKTAAKEQLAINEQSVAKLQTAYKQFIENPENIIGGVSTGTGDKDGDNARIILDALPSQYDFPALTSSLEKLLLDRNVKINNITGTDDEINQASSGAVANPDVAPATNADGSEVPPEQVGTSVAIPFDVGFQTSYAGVKDIIGVFERSIRPFNVSQLEFKADKDGQVVVTVRANTYYQPAKNLKIDQVVVK